MTTFISAFLIAAILLAAVLLISLRIVYGKILSDEEFDDAIDFNKEDWGISSLDSRQLIDYELGIGITNNPVPFLCKWHIQEVGQIPIWSEAHKKIENKFRELKR